MIPLKQIPDDALIEAALRGEGSAAARLYHRYVDRVHRICYRIVLNPSEVKDCVQEVWLKVFQHLDRFQPGKPFGPWLNSITVHTAIDFYRKSSGSQSHAVSLQDPNGAPMAEDSPNGAQWLEESHNLDAVLQALQEISLTQRTVFILRFFEDLPPAEIAQMLHCSVNTIRTHIRRSLLALRQILADKILR